MAGYAGELVKGYNGTVQFDGSYVTIRRTGALGRLSVGKGEKRIPLMSITAVQWKEPGALVNGFIQFTVAGGIERRSQFGRQTFDAVGDENSVIIRKHHAAPFRALKDAIEAAIAKGGSSATPQPDPMEQLRKLGELRDSGLITPEEFEAKKSDLLSRM